MKFEYILYHSTEMWNMTLIAYLLNVRKNNLALPGNPPSFFYILVVVVFSLFYHPNLMHWNCSFKKCFVIHFQAIYNSLGSRRHQLENVNRQGGQYIREAKVSDCLTLQTPKLFPELLTKVLFSFVFSLDVTMLANPS